MLKLGVGALSRRRLLGLAAGTMAATMAAGTALAVNFYGIGTEFDANFGIQLKRTERAVTCVGGGFGFVFNDMWQGVQADAGWIEVGTSYCDQGDPDAKWIWARQTPALPYWESVIQTDIPIGTNHTFKIWNSNAGFWSVYIDGSNKSGSQNLGVGSSANSADVGIEVHPNRINSTQDTTNNTNLLKWAVQGTSSSWSGADDCSDTSADIYPQWIAFDWWRTALNVVKPVSAC